MNDHDSRRPLAGRTALITGAGRNIGKAIVLALASAGANVVVNARANQAEAEAVAAEAESLGVRALPVLADLGDLDQVRALARTALETFGRIDLLINNAAGPRMVKPFLEITEADWRIAQRVVLDGTFFLTQALVPGMIAGGGGAIVNVAGASIFRGQRDRAHFMAAKSGLIGLTRALAVELGEHNIRVNCLVPDWIETSRVPGQQYYGQSEGPAIPLGRRGQPEDIADVCLFLVSDPSRFVTGQIVHVNGGTVLG